MLHPCCHCLKIKIVAAIFIPYLPVKINPNRRLFAVHLQKSVCKQRSDSCFQSKDPVIPIGTLLLKRPQYPDALLEQSCQKIFNTQRRSV